MQLFQASSCSSNKHSTALSDLKIGELSDAKTYADTLTDDLKNNISCVIQDKIMSPSTVSASAQVNRSANIEITQQGISSNKDGQQVDDQLKLILIDLYGK
ncbi:hypothetical protein [Cardinium endosymbiont of Nabis limbatus]|uniref:hypothetical protein n=1 Tax=Cardinium endosymbiont of Nabis limbatus TaxID=3066217 RepID=UPI003AF39C8F